MFRGKDHFKRKKGNVSGANCIIRLQSLIAKEEGQGAYVNVSLEYC